MSLAAFQIAATWQSCKYHKDLLNTLLSLPTSPNQFIPSSNSWKASRGLKALHVRSQQIIEVCFCFFYVVQQLIFIGPMIIYLRWRKTKVIGHMWNSNPTVKRGDMFENVSVQISIEVILGCQMHHKNRIAPSCFIAIQEVWITSFFHLSISSCFNLLSRCRLCGSAWESTAFFGLRTTAEADSWIPKGYGIEQSDKCKNSLYSGTLLVATEVSTSGFDHHGDGVAQQWQGM